MGLSSVGLLVLVAGSVLSAQTLSPNVCVVQTQYDRPAKTVEGQPPTTELVVVRGRAVFSPRGFWVLSESGCNGIPLAEALKSVTPKVSFQLVKDDKYQELQNARDRSRHNPVFVEVEGRLDRIGRKARNVRNGGSGAIHIFKYDYMLVLRRVLVVQLQ